MRVFVVIINNNPSAAFLEEKAAFDYVEKIKAIDEEFNDKQTLFFAFYTLEVIE